MAIFDIFRKKPSSAKPARQAGRDMKGKREKAKKEKLEVKEPKVVAKEKIQKAPEIEKRKARKRKKFPESYRVLKIPHVTEKATDLTKQDQYIFKVQPETNKIEVKKTVEDIYNIDVVSVKIINVPPKRRRLGRTLGWRKGYKKAIVRIKKGQKIEVLPR